MPGAPDLAGFLLTTRPADRGHPLSLTARHLIKVALNHAQAQLRV